MGRHSAGWGHTGRAQPTQAGLAGKFLEGEPPLSSVSPLQHMDLGPAGTSGDEPAVRLLPRPGQATQVEMGPRGHTGLHRCHQHHGTLPMDGVGLAGALWSACVFAAQTHTRRG